MFCENAGKLISALEGLGYAVHSAQTKEEARDIALDLIGSGSVGLGGSMTIKSMGLPDALRTRGNRVYDHGACKTPQEQFKVHFLENSADWYLTSANALTADGKIMNIDGNGNRVAAMMFGPKNVIMAIGKNKLAGDLEAAYRRIKEVAAPLNAKRLHRNTPCAATGKCTDCASPERICGMTAILERKPKLIGSFHIILVDEELGF